MINIENVRAINKGSLLASCDVHIVPWKLRLKEVKIFEKGQNRWIGLPSREITSDMGEKKYVELIAFDNETVKNKFRDQIMGAIDKYMETNPKMEPEAVIKEEDDFPF